jgi:hypothetical protein
MEDPEEEAREVEEENRRLESMQNLCGDEKLSHVQATIRNVDWESGGKVHNWRRYVSDHFRQLWNTLSEREQIILYVVANEAASKEHWD